MCMINKHFYRWYVFIALVALGASGCVFDEEGGAAQEVLLDSALDEPVQPPHTEPALNLTELIRESEQKLDKSLDDIEPAVRIDACRVLEEIADPQWVDALRRLLAHDPDAVVRGCAAVSLGMLADTESRITLEELYKSAEPVLRVSYAEALYRLGTPRARAWLVRFASHENIEIAFQAALRLADISRPRDKTATRALQSLAQDPIDGIAPFADIVILTKLARLGHGKAREQLYKYLEAPDERRQIAAAEGLARLGDDAGKSVLIAVVNDGQSPNRVYAARLLVMLGDYHGEEILDEALASDQAALRRTAARGLGDMGAKDSLRALLALYQDAEPTVQVAAAAAVLFILGLDPKVLAQASVDWARSAIAADEWTVRYVATRSLGDIPEEKAVPLLAQVVMDPEPQVRKAAAQSASRMKSVEAAVHVATALEHESEADVQEEQVRALAHIGASEARSALEKVATDRNRVGVLAFGSLIAVGDVTYAPRLDLAYDRGTPPIRLAVMDAAILAENPVVVPILKKGTGDSVSNIRLRAAEGLAHYRVLVSRAVEILQAHADEDNAIVVRGRALKGLLQLDIEPPGAISIPDLVLSPAPEIQRAMLPVLEAMKFEEAAPLLMQVGKSADVEVRRRVVDVIGEHARDKSNEEGAGRLYKLMIKDGDSLTRAKAKAQLARFVPPILPDDASVPAASGPVDVSGVAQQLAAVEARQAEFQALHDELARAVDAITKKTTRRANSENEIDEVARLGTKVVTLDKRLVAAYGRVAEEAEKTAEAAATVNAAEADALVERARAMTEKTQVMIASAGDRAGQAASAAQRYLSAETAKCELYLTAAEAAIPAGRVAAAGRDLHKAETVCRSKAMTSARLNYLFGWYHDTAAETMTSPRKRRRHLTKAKDRYERFLKVGNGYRLEQARERIDEITSELDGQASP